MPNYIRIKEKYCGCINVQYFSMIASCISLAIQITFSLFFIIYGSLWGLLPLILTTLSHVMILLALTQFKSTVFVLVFIAFETAFAFTILGFGVWILSWILDPQMSFLYIFCRQTEHIKNCSGHVQLYSFIWGLIFIIFFFISIMLLPIHRNVIRNIKIKRKDSDIFSSDDQRSNPPQTFNINLPSPQVPVIQHPITQIILPQTTSTPSPDGEASSVVASGAITLQYYTSTPTNVINSSSNEKVVSSTCLDKNAN